MNIPTQASICRECGKRFWRLTPDGHRIQGSLRLAKMDPGRFFCTLRCAAVFGIKAVPQL